MMTEYYYILVFLIVLLISTILFIIIMIFKYRRNFTMRFLIVVVMTLFVNVSAELDDSIVSADVIEVPSDIDKPAFPPVATDAAGQINRGVAEVIDGWSQELAVQQKFRRFLDDNTTVNNSTINLTEQFTIIIA